MNRVEFLEKMVDVLQTDDEITFETKLEDLEEWDSLAVMSTIAFLDKNFGVKAVYTDFVAMKTIEDIAIKAGI